MRKRSYYDLAYARGATMKRARPSLSYAARMEWALLHLKRTHTPEAEAMQYLRGWLDGYAAGLKYRKRVK